ncbi:MAG: sensor histidine kinase [Bacteroidia bacterium]
MNKDTEKDIVFTYQLLLTLSLAVSSAKDIDTALLTILQKICETTGWAAGDVWFIQPNDKVKIRVSYCSEASKINEFCSAGTGIELAKGEGLPGMAWERKNAVWIKDLSELEVFPRRAIAEDYGLKTAMAIPIPLNDEVIAILAFYLTEQSDEQKEFIKLVTAIAGQVGVLVKQKQTEEMLKNSEMRFRSLMQSSPEAVFIADVHGNIIIANPAAERMFGYTKDEMVGHPLEIIMPESYRERHRNGMERYKQTHEPHVIGKMVEVEGLRKDNTIFPIELSVGTWQNNEEEFFSGIIRDITVRKEAENKIMQKQRDLEQFAYVASHDMKEPLRMISSYSKLLIRKCEGLDNDSKEFGNYIEEAVSRMQALINDLLVYGKAGEELIEKVPVDCTKIMEGVRNALRIRTDETDTEIIYSQLPVVYGSPSQLNQLFQNLIENAIKFRKTDTTPVIKIDAKRTGAFWQFAVADNGIGMEQRFEDRVFKIFQRLHNRQDYPGTGIGLAICKKIVENHGGKIWFTSVLGEGTTFYFTLPAA